MEFLRIVRRRSLLSEVAYILLNLALAAAVTVAVIVTSTPWLALALVLLSKWRVFAVRPRYWLAHIEANTVDFIVGIGVVVLLYVIGQTGGQGVIGVQLGLAVLYALWLLFVKPRSKRSFVIAQAAVAVAVGTTALMSLSYEWPSSAVVIIMWIIGYASARHVLSAYSETSLRFLSLVWGFVFAEIGWLLYHWTIAYKLPFVGELKLSQLTIIVLLISFVAERIYASYVKHNKIQSSDVLLPLLLSLGLIVVLELFFNAAAIGAV
jgi:hypothetical protein